MKTDEPITLTWHPNGTVTATRFGEVQSAPRSWISQDGKKLMVEDAPSVVSIVQRYADEFRDGEYLTVYRHPDLAEFRYRLHPAVWADGDDWPLYLAVWPD